MLSKPLCDLFETAFSEKRLVRIQVEGVNLVVAVELPDLLKESNTKPFARIYICDPQTQYRDVLQSRIVDLSTVANAELLGPYSEEVRRAIWPELEGIWPVERQLKP